MRRTHLILVLTALLVIAPVLAGCEDLDLDKFDIFGIGDKKKLKGERKDLFPNGVPGVSQGIPPEYLKGNQPPPDTAQTPAAEPANAAPAPGGKTAAVAPADEPKPKPKRKPKPKPQTAARPTPTQITVQPKPKGQDQQPMAPWPDQQPQQGQQPSGQSSSTAPWPSAPTPGTFSR